MSFAKFGASGIQFTFVDVRSIRIITYICLFYITESLLHVSGHPFWC